MAVATAEAASDRELVTAACAGDQQAFAGLYDRYFDSVYSFVARMTRDRDEAADIAQDTFLKAMNALAGLRQGASFKSWIFAIARNTALNRLERSSRTRPLTFEDEAGEELGLDLVDSDRFGRPEEAAEARAMASLVWEAAAGLDPKQLSLLQIHLHQGLESAEIAGVMGVTKNNGYVMLNRLKKAVEEAIEAYIMLHNGRRYCEALDLALEDVGIREMTPDVRKTVHKHVAACAECGERKRKMVRPLAVFGAFLPVPAPARLKAEVLGQLMSRWPGPSSVEPAGPAGPPPGPEGRGLLPTRVLNAAIGLGAFAAVLLAVILFTPLNLARTGDDSDDDPLPIVIDNRTPTPTPSGPAASPGPTEPLTPGAVPTPTPTPGAGETATPATPGSGGGGSELSTPTGTATPTSTGTQTSTPTGTPTRTPTPTATACIAQLEDNVNGRLNIGTESAGSFVVFNRAPCGGVSVVVTSSETWLSAAPSEFEIGPTGQTGNRTIVVSVNRAALPPGAQLGIVTVAPASGPAVSVVVSAAGATPTPTATPTSTPTPTATATPDLVAPALALATCVVSGEPPVVTVRASASDPSSVDDVFLTWAGGPTVRMSLESGSATDGVWSGSATLSSPPPDEIHLIALDANGNRTDAFFGFTSQCF